MPNTDPNDPARRKPPEVQVSLAAFESAAAFVEGHPGELKSEEDLDKELQVAARTANPENSTLKAMEGK